MKTLAEKVHATALVLDEIKPGWAKNIPDSFDVSDGHNCIVYHAFRDRGFLSFGYGLSQLYQYVVSESGQEMFDSVLNEHDGNGFLVNIPEKQVLWKQEIERRKQSLPTPELEQLELRELVTA